MSRILKDLPWENIIAATLVELEEEARAHTDVDQFNVEDEFETEDVLAILVQQIQNSRPDLPRYVASNMVSQLFRGNGYVKTPKGQRPLSKTARRENVAESILYQLALQMGAHDPEFDITQALNVNYSSRPRAERRAEVVDDGLTVIQRVTRSFGTDELDRILPAYQAAFGEELSTNEALLNLFESFREKAFFYSPVMFVADIENVAKSVLEASLQQYMLSARFERLDSIDKTSLLLRAYLDLTTPAVQTIHDWNALLRTSMQHAEILRAKLNLPQQNSLQGLSQLDKPRSAAPIPVVAGSESQQRLEIKLPEPILEDVFGLDDIGEMVAWLQWTFEDEISKNQDLRLLVDDLIYFDDEQLVLSVAFARIKMAAAEFLEISPKELNEIYQNNFKTKIPHIELAFHLMALIQGKSLLATPQNQLKSRIQDATFRILQRLSDAAHDYQSETRMVERMLIVKDDDNLLDADVYDSVTGDEPAVSQTVLQPSPIQAEYSYPIQPQPWHRPKAKSVFHSPSFLQGQSNFTNSARPGLSVPVRQSPEVRSMLSSVGLTPILASQMTTGFFRMR